MCDDKVSGERMRNNIRRRRAEKGMWLRNGSIFLKEDFLKSYFFSLSPPLQMLCKVTVPSSSSELTFLFVIIIEVRYYLSTIVLASQMLCTALEKHVRVMQGTSPPGSSHSAHMGNSVV